MVQVGSRINPVVERVNYSELGIEAQNETENVEQIVIKYEIEIKKLTKISDALNKQVSQAEADLQTANSKLLEEVECSKVTIINRELKTGERGVEEAKQRPFKPYNRPPKDDEILESLEKTVVQDWHQSRFSRWEKGVTPKGIKEVSGQFIWVR